MTSPVPELADSSTSIAERARSSFAGKDFHRRVAPVDGDHAATRVGASPAQEYAWHRCSRFKSTIPHVRGQTLPLKDVAARQPDFPLDVGRAEHLDIKHGLGDVVAVTGDRPEREVFDIVATTLPIAAGEFVGHVLGEDTHRVYALGRDSSGRAPSGNRARSTADPVARQRGAVTGPTRHSSFVNGVLIWPR